MRPISGRKARARKSNGGAAGLWVPPSSVSVEGAAPVRSPGSTVWKTSPVLPAVPIAKRYSPGFTAPGRKTSVAEPSVAPSTSAPPTTTAALTAVRCWRRSPGFERRARICSMRNGVPVTRESASAVRRICPPPSPCEPSMVSTTSPLDTHDLVEGVHDLDEVTLRLHHRVDRLVGSRRLVDDVGILPALDARGGGLMIRQGEAPLRLAARHGATGAVAATLVAFRAPAPAHDVGARAHASRDDAEVARSCAHGALACDEDFASAVALARHVIMVAVHRRHAGLEGRDPRYRPHGLHDSLHHEPAVRHRIVLGPADGFHVLLEVRRTFLEIREILVRQVCQMLAHILFRQLDEVRA